MPANNPSTLTILLRLAAHLKRHWRWFAIGFISSITLALMWLLPPFLTSVLIDSAIPNHDTRLLVLLALAIAGAGLVILLLEITESYCLERASHSVVRDLRNALFDSVQSQPYRFFIKNDAGAINSRMWNDVGEVQWVVNVALVETASSVLMVIATLAFMLAWNWELTLLLLALWPLILGIGFIVGKVRERIAISEAQWFDDNSSFIFERLNIDGSILLNGVGYDSKTDSRKFAAMTAKFRDLSVRRGVANQYMATLGMIFPLVSSAIIYFYGGLGVMDGELTLGVLVAFVALSMRIASPLAQLSAFQVDIAASVVHLRRIFEWIDLEPEVRDSPEAMELATVEGFISVKNASVEYDAGNPVISDLSLDFQPGKMTAIVGRSGVGKTTLTHLILRFYDPTSGSVEIDGHDLRSVKLSSLRRHLSLVPQDSAVFNTSVRENLLIAKPDASDTDIVNACKAAQLHDFLNSLPEGYDTVVGDLGYRLSGGERQRLAIARVILKQPRIVILDEPTSSLDSITERAIKDALESTLFRNATTIVIAHRLATILNADNIIVLDEGRLIDSGHHEELLARCDLYNRLYQEQFAPQSATTTPTPRKKDAKVPSPSMG